MKKLNEMKMKASEKAANVKEWVSDHKAELIYGGIVCAGVVGCAVCGVRSYKKTKAACKAWDRALEALNRKDTGFDYGPYKIARFFEPNTGDFMGEIPCHVDAVKAFLNMRKES